MGTDVSILIVNYNTCRLLDACLASVRAVMRCAYEVVVVDNASGDGSAEMARTKHPDVTLIANPGNVGFATANNQASALAQGRYLFLLNPDTLIVGDAIGLLAAFLDAHPDAGACGPRHLDGNGNPRVSYFRFPTFWSSFWRSASLTPLRRYGGKYQQARRYQPVFDRIQEVDYIQGSGLMIRRDLYQQLRGLDEHFFMYAEEIDLCYRVRQAGYTVVFVPQAAIVHHGGASLESAGMVRVFGKIGRYTLHSRYYFLRKTYGVLPSLALRATDLCVGIWLWAKSLACPDPAKRRNHTQLARLFCRTALLPVHTHRNTDEPR